MYDLDEYTKTSITNYLTSNAERIQKFYENKVMSSLIQSKKKSFEKGFSGDNFTNIVLDVYARSRTNFLYL